MVAPASLRVWPVLAKWGAVVMAARRWKPRLDTTCGVAVDDAGHLYLSSEWANNIRRVDAQTGIITLFAGQDARFYPPAQSAGNSYTSPRASLMGYHGDGGPASAAAFHHPEHLAFDSHGNLYVCDNSNDRVRKIDIADRADQHRVGQRSARLQR